MKATSKHGKLGDRPIETKHAGVMNALAHSLDEVFNGNLTGSDRQVGFILMIFPFGGNADPGHRANYISNANREDVITLLKEQLAHFEGQSRPEGRA